MFGELESNHEQAIQQEQEAKIKQLTLQLASAQEFQAFLINERNATVMTRGKSQKLVEVAAKKNKDLIAKNKEITSELKKVKRQEETLTKECKRLRQENAVLLEQVHHLSYLKNGDVFWSSSSSSRTESSKNNDLSPIPESTFKRGIHSLYPSLFGRDNNALSLDLEENESEEEVLATGTVQSPLRVKKGKA